MTDNTFPLAGVRRHAPVLLLMTLAAIVLLAGSAGRELHGTPTFYASLIRELADSGDILHIFRGPDAYLLKPPLMLWGGAIASWVFGLGNFSVTLLPRLAAIACVGLTWLVVRQVAGPRAGWIAGFMLLTNGTFIQFSTTLRMDSALLCGLLMVLAGWLSRPAAWSSPLFFGGITIGLLAKGPLVLFALPLCALWSMLAGQPHRLVLDWRWSILLMPALAWLGFVFAEHGMQQVSDLSADLYRPDPNSGQSAWASYYAEYIRRPALRFWPWLPFMLAGLVLAGLASGRVDPARRAALRWFACWVVIVFAMCALKPDRDIRYLYIALPALAGLGAVPLAGWLTERGFDRCVLAAGLLTIAVGIAAVLGIGTRDTRAQVDAMRAALVAAGPALDGRAPVVIGDYPLRPGLPRRQLTQRDWIHFYLGVVPRIVPWSRVKSGGLAGEPIVFTVRTGDFTGALAAAGFVPRQLSKEMVMAVPK
jgi:4-amino-4-deoxy-L-arabinose transferase-like glycosyltransferase